MTRRDEQQTHKCRIPGKNKPMGSVSASSPLRPRSCLARSSAIERSYERVKGQNPTMRERTGARTAPAAHPTASHDALCRPWHPMIFVSDRT